MNEKAIITWLAGHVAAEFPDLEVVEIWRGHRQLRFLRHGILSFCEGVEGWEFTPDFVVVVQEKHQRKVGFANFSKSTLGLTELGELNIISRIAQPFLSLQITRGGMSKDLYTLLLDQDAQERVLNYGTGKILIGHWDAAAGAINSNEFFPPQK